MAHAVRGPDGGGLAAIKAAGIKPVSSTPIPASWTPHLLRLPDAVFGVLLGRTMKSRSRGALVRCGKTCSAAAAPKSIICKVSSPPSADRHGLHVPLSRRIVTLIRSAKPAARVSPKLTPEQNPPLNRWLVTLTCLEIAIISSEFRIGGHAQIRRVSAGRNDMKRFYASCAVAVALGGWASLMPASAAPADRSHRHRDMTRGAGAEGGDGAGH